MRYVSRITLFFLLFTSAFAQEKFAWTYIYTIDGDSILFYADWVPLEKKTIIVRLDGIDTPERHSLCKKERELAYEAKEFVEEEMKAREVLVQPISWDKFGGRILARVFVNGEDLSKKILMAGLAREYHGELKKSWC